MSDVFAPGARVRLTAPWRGRCSNGCEREYDARAVTFTVARNQRPVAFLAGSVPGCVWCRDDLRRVLVPLPRERLAVVPFHEESGAT